MYLLISHPHPEASSQNDERIENVSISSPSPLQSPSPISHYAKLCSSSTNKLLGIIKGKSRLKHGMGWGWEKPRAGQRNAIASGLSPIPILCARHSKSAIAAAGAVIARSSCRLSSVGNANRHSCHSRQAKSSHDGTALLAPGWCFWLAGASRVDRHKTTL